MAPVTEGENVNTPRYKYSKNNRTIYYAIFQFLNENRFMISFILIAAYYGTVEDNNTE